MIRISKLTDYGIVLLTHFAKAPAATLTARGLSLESAIPLPTVGKILKLLAGASLLNSQRGLKGGYSLAKVPKEISIATIIAALEGPIALTQCTMHEEDLCELEPACPVKSNWRKINNAVSKALEGLTLADMNLPSKRMTNGRYQEPLLTLVKRKSA